MSEIKTENTILTKDDIFLLIQQNEKEKQEFDLIKKNIASHNHDFSKGAFNRHEFYKAVLFDDMQTDGYVMEYPHGKVIRQSDRLWHYRGENSYYPTSQPTFVRKLVNKSRDEKSGIEFVANLKLHEFYNLLTRLNHLYYFRNICFTRGDKRIYLDILFHNIAQHYGFDTNWLDLTSDFEVALFFACCKYSGNKWMPLTNNDINKNEYSKYGRIFRRSANSIKNMMIPEDRYAAYPVGFQPFMRCHMQYSYAILMDEDMDLNDSNSGFEFIKFRHSEELCNYIFTKMCEGKLIYPHEGLNLILDEIEKIQNSDCFPIETFQKVYQDQNWGYTEDEIMKILNMSGIIIGKPTVFLSQSKIDLVNKYYETFDIEKTYNITLRTRWTFTPESKI